MLWLTKSVRGSSLLLLFLGLLSCYGVAGSTSRPDNTPPNVTISIDKPSLEVKVPGTVTFSFNEPVTGFTKNDIVLFNDNVTTDKFYTSDSKKYTLNIIPKKVGQMTVVIFPNSLADLPGNSNTTIFSNSFKIEKDITPPMVTSINSETLLEGQAGYLSFVFSEDVELFSVKNINFSGVDVSKGEFVTNNLHNYSLKITPQKKGTLEVTISNNSFRDLIRNVNTSPYKTEFDVFSSDATTHTISFKLNGGTFISPQITNLKVVDGKTVDQAQLRKILSYPPTGPQPEIVAVTRDIYKWQKTDGTKYGFSKPITDDITLEAVWSNSCGKVENLHPPNTSQLLEYRDDIIDPKNKANFRANLNHIDTSAITDMKFLFSKMPFNGNIECWNTANVRNMAAMFRFANFFNQDISGWNVSKVTDMSGMFASAFVFNQDIGNWNVSSVTTMNGMFQNARVFNQDVGNWNVSSVTAMGSMFKGTKFFNQNIGSWDVSKVAYMQSMFEGADEFNQDIGKWDVSKVTSMKKMFQNAKKFRQDLSLWPINRFLTPIKWEDMFKGSGMDGYTKFYPKYPDPNAPPSNSE